MATEHEITDEQWMHEVLRAHKPNDPGRTMREWCDYWLVSDRVAGARIRRAVAAGIMSVGRRSEYRVDGVPCLKPVYSVVKRAKK